MNALTPNQVERYKFPSSKGHNRQHCGQMSQLYKNDKTIDIQSVSPTAACGKVQSEKNG